jgi:hypothetical protein
MDLGWLVCFIDLGLGPSGAVIRPKSVFCRGGWVGLGLPLAGVLTFHNWRG